MKVRSAVTTKLEQTLNALSRVENRHFRAWLESSYFNTRTDVLLLYDWLCAHPLEPKEHTFQQVYPDTPFDAQRLRLVMSYLQQLAEQYLAYVEWSSTPGAYETDLVRAVRKRGLEAHFPEALRTAKSVLHRQPLRNTDYYTHWGRLLWEEARFESVRDASAVRYLEALSDHADLAWSIQKLRYLCLHRAQQIVYQSDHALRFRAEVEAIAQQAGWLEVPGVAVWYYCLNMLEQPESPMYFTRFKETLLAEDALFDREEVRDLHLFAVNYCIRRVNVGQRSFFNDIMDFYKDGLRKGYLLDKGQLSRFTYHNIVAAGLQTREFDWVEDFLHRYKSALERSHRESSYSFNKARLEFARKRYDEVLPLLQNSNYHDPLLSLSAKSMALKIYYETGEQDLLHSHLEAMKNYIRRKSTLGYHRTYYLNLVTYTQKLAALDWTDKRKVEQLRQRILQETALTEREWLLEQFTARRAA
ncbi:MAG TPA: hypothetical protein PK971_06385 [Saprospiraceae bacterium]|nr:hypothetical protein [Saprospiraceae bacterium]